MGIFDNHNVRSIGNSLQALLDCATRKDVGYRQEVELMRQTLRKKYPESEGHFYNAMEDLRTAPTREAEIQSLREEISRLQKIIESSQEKPSVADVQAQLAALTERLEVNSTPQQALGAAKEENKVTDFFSTMYGRK